MGTKHYDVIVIGTGAGTKLVRPVAALGRKVAVIEKHSLGGTCLNRGCIPSKMLLHPAEIIEHIDQACRFHIEARTLSVDPQALLKEVFSKIARESNSIEPLYESHPNIDLYRATARFIDPRTIQAGDNLLKADRIIIATGARPKVPDIAGLAKTPFWTYNEFMELKKLPKSITIIGTGFIGVELGYFLSMFGVKTTFLARGGLLSKEDEQIQEYFTKRFCEKHSVLLDTQVDQVRYSENTKNFTIDLQSCGKKQTVESEALLIATGITPNVEQLQLDQAGVSIDASTGFIQVDSCMQTSTKGIYALGDCVGNHFFRHSANFEGQWLFEHLFAGKKGPIAYPPMPHAVFSSPQIAAVGPTEQELKKKHVDYRVVVQYYRDSAMGMALKSEGDFVKLIFSPKEGKILAVHIIGHEAANLLHIPLAIMQRGGTCIDLAEMVYVHPALAEVVRNAARKALELIEPQ